MQIFHPSANTLSRISIFGAVLFIAAMGWALNAIQRSSYVTQAGIAREQPVQFSHAHHVGGLGIDCRYCHTSVENSNFAVVPPTSTCMNCHSQVWIRARRWNRCVRVSGPKSMKWTRVNDLPDYVYFNHSIHVKKGVGCETCHGRVDEMGLTYQNPSLQMRWCLDCHRNPEKYLRPRDQITKMGYEPWSRRQSSAPVS